MRRVANVLDRRQRSPGQHDSNTEGVTLSRGETLVHLVLDRLGWPTRSGTPPNSEVIHAQLWISYNDGTDWEMLGGVGTEGGEYFNRFGDLQVATTMTIQLPQSNNAQRRLQVRTNVRSELTTAAHLDIA